MEPRGFDVFLSYSRSDEAAVQQLADVLRARKLSPFLDKWYLHPGSSWQRELEEHLGRSRSVAICLGPDGMGSWQQREKELALARCGSDPRFAVIPVLLPGTKDPALGFLGLHTWVDLRDGLSDAPAIEVLYRAIRGLPPGPPDTTPPDPRQAICPYRGLLPFREEDALFFFGREAFTSTLLLSIAHRRLVAVVGASGSGKSSVARAGLIPALRAGGTGQSWEVLTIDAPGTRPLHALMGVLSPPSPDASIAQRLAQTELDVEMLRTRKLSLDRFASEILRRQPGSERLLLLVDQFEELWTQCKSAEDRDHFLDLIAVGTADGSLTVVLTLRGDFVGTASEHRAFADRLQGAIVPLGPLRRSELEASILKPAESTGLRFEDGLVQHILDEVGNEPGNLPLLEFLLTKLWQRRDRDQVVTFRSYTKIGGVRKAIATIADEVLSTLDQKRELPHARQLLLSLVQLGDGGGDSRARAAMPKNDIALSIVSKFADARLIVTGTADGSEVSTIEVSHEALIREWGTLRKWIEEDREFLRAIGRVRSYMLRWQTSKSDPSLLLPAGRLLAEAQELLKQKAADLDPDVVDFIRLSARRATRTRWIFRSLVTIITIGILSASGVISWALYQQTYAQYMWRSAQASRDELQASNILSQIDAKSGNLRRYETLSLSALIDLHSDMRAALFRQISMSSSNILKLAYHAQIITRVLQPPLTEREARTIIDRAIASVEGITDTSDLVALAHLTQSLQPTPEQAQSFLNKLSGHMDHDMLSSFAKTWPELLELVRSPVTLSDAQASLDTLVISAPTREDQIVELANSIQSFGPLFTEAEAASVLGLLLATLASSNDDQEIVALSQAVRDVSRNMRRPDTILIPLTNKLGDVKSDKAATAVALTIIGELMEQGDIWFVYGALELSQRSTIGAAARTLFLQSIRARFPDAPGENASVAANVDWAKGKFPYVDFSRLLTSSSR